MLQGKADRALVEGDLDTAWQAYSAAATLTAGIPQLRSEHEVHKARLGASPCHHPACGAVGTASADLTRS